MDEHDGVLKRIREEDEYTSRYFGRKEEDKLKPGTVFTNTKKLKDGGILELSCEVSCLEFNGTPAYNLSLRNEFSEDLFSKRPYGSMLSEPAYRKIMGKIETSEDFYRIQDEMESVLENLWEDIDSDD